MTIAQKISDAIPLFRSDPDLIKKLNEIAFEKSIAKGDTLAGQSSQCAFLPLVLSGSLKVIKTAESGREIILYRIEKGESCILTATCILNKALFPAIAMAEDNTELVLIPSSVMDNFIKTSDTMRKFIFSLYSRRLDAVLLLLEEIAFNRVDIRLAKFLLQTRQEEISMTHQEIASHIGTSREVVSRILKDLESKMAVKLDRGKLTILDTQLLKKMQNF